MLSNIFFFWTNPDPFILLFYSPSYFLFNHLIYLFIDPVVLAIEESRLQLLPWFDKDAILPGLVYDAQSIAGEDAWCQISRVVDACVGKGPDDWAKALMHGPRL